MNLYEKYQSLGLCSQYLLSWIDLDEGNLTDNGPNSNNWTEIGSSLVFSGQSAIFNNSRIDMGYALNAFSLTADIKRNINSPSILVHNYSGGSGEFIFGVLASDLFFVGRPNDSGCGIQVFDQIICPSRAIISLSKQNNYFTLSYLEPVSSGVNSQTVSLPPSQNTGNNIQMGVPNVSGYNQSIFGLNQAFIMDRVPPNFIAAQLNSTFYSGSDPNWRNRSLNIFDNYNNFNYEDTSGVSVNKNNSNHVPQWSNWPTGFGIYQGYGSSGEGKFYTSGELINGYYYFDPSAYNSSGDLITSVQHPGIFSYTGMSPSDPVLYDSLYGAGYTGSLPINITGQNFTQVHVAPFGEIVYNYDNKRLSPHVLEYISVGSSNPIYLKQAYAPNRQSLFDLFETVYNPQGFNFIFNFPLA